MVQEVKQTPEALGANAAPAAVGVPTDYKYEKVQGQAFNRFHNINISNPSGATPYVTCSEQRVIEFSDGKTITVDDGALSFVFDPQFVFPIINPIDLKPTGANAKGEDLYVLIMSMLLAQAKSRDVKNNATSGKAYGR